MSRKGYPQHETDTERCLFNWSYPSGTVVPYVIEQGYTSFSADKVGGNTPGWPGVKGQTNYTAWSFDTRVQSLGLEGHNLSDGGTVSGNYPVIQATNSPAPEVNFDAFMGPLKSMAIDRFNSRIVTKLKDQKVNVGLVLAELNKTAGTIADAARRIAYAYEAVRSRNISGALRILAGGDLSRTKKVRPSLGSAAKDWLAIQYGWTPLLKDVYGAAEELARVTTYQAPVQSVSSRCGTTDDESHSGIDAGASYPKHSTNIKGQVTINGRVEYRVSSQMAATAANTGITNPQSIIWELVPYSFVVDWFLPVGNYLNNMDATNGLEFSRGFYAIKTECTYTVVPESGFVTNGSNVLHWTGGKIECYGTSYERTILGGFPAMPTPKLKSPISLVHAANAIALLKVAFNGGSRYR